MKNFLIGFLIGGIVAFAAAVVAMFVGFVWGSESPSARARRRHQTPSSRIPYDRPFGQAPQPAHKEA